MDKINDVEVLHLKSLYEKDYTINNDMITNIFIAISCSYNPILKIQLRNYEGYNFFPDYDVSKNLGKILQTIFVLLDISVNITEENGLYMHEIKNVPIRVIKNQWGKVIGMGHFIKDKFILFSDLTNI